MDRMDYDAIFAEYYALFRSQATNIPVAEAPEYELGLHLARNSVRKWDRADGVQWNELWQTAVLDGTGDLQTVEGTTEYAAPTNMRKPPKYIYLGNQSNAVKVVTPAQAENLSGLVGVAYFTGSANTGYILNYDPGTTSGFEINFVYLRKPTKITKGSSKPDMSDVNFMIQDMLASRFLGLRNGFGYKIAKNEATLALQNMKIENRNDSENLLQASGWGIGGGTHRASII